MLNILLQDLSVDICWYFENTNKVIFESTRRGNGNDKTNKKKNGANDKEDKNMKVMNVSHGGKSPLIVENTKNQGKKIMNISQGEKSKLIEKKSSCKYCKVYSRTYPLELRSHGDLCRGPKIW